MVHVCQELQLQQLQDLPTCVDTFGGIMEACSQELGRRQVEFILDGGPALCACVHQRESQAAGTAGFQSM